jgi:hypothetical protein
MKTINSPSTPSRSLSSSGDRTKRPRVSPNAGIFSRDAPRPQPERATPLMLRPITSIDRRQNNDSEKSLTTRQQPSLLSTILEQITCGPTTDMIVEEPPEVCYQPPRNCNTDSVPPMSPPVIYVHRYRPPQYDENCGPTASFHKKINSFDTEITAATSHTEEGSEENATMVRFAGKKIHFQEDHVLDGRATPVVSNRSSSITRRSLYVNAADADDDCPPIGLGHLQQCVCFDDDDVQEAPHAQSILMENRNRLIAMMHEQQ